MTEAPSDRRVTNLKRGGVVEKQHKVCWEGFGPPRATRTDSMCLAVRVSFFLGVLTEMMESMV